MDAFSQGFVDILAAEQTPDNPNWYQGTADAVRQAARHFVRFDADYYLIEAGAAYKPIPVTGKLGYEVLGGDGTWGFQTPLATLHSFLSRAHR